MYETAAKRALELTGAIIQETGPRLAGSEASRLAATRLAEEAAKSCDSVGTESFPVHPGAFLGFIKILVVLYTIAAPLLSILPWLSALLASVGLAILVLEFFLYKELIDPFYPRLEGVNVIGVVEPKGPVKRQVIVSGHHDSARIFNFFVDKPELYARRVYGGIGAFALLWLASLLTSIFAGGIARIVVAGLFTLAIGFVLPLWQFASEKGTPGAGDNLSASAAALEIVKEFRARRDAGAGLESTRLLFVSFDAEEAGLRGARAFAKRRRAEVAALPSFAFNMDCIYRRDRLRLLLSDLNGSVALDGASAQAIAEMGKAWGLSVATLPIAFLTGGTDAAELAKIGIRSASLMGMDWSNAERAAVYHTPSDKVEAVEPEAIEGAIRLGVGFIEGIDKGAI